MNLKDITTIIKTCIFMSVTIPLFIILEMQYGLGIAFIGVGLIFALFTGLFLLFLKAEKEKEVTNEYM